MSRVIIIIISFDNLIKYCTYKIYFKHLFFVTRAISCSTIVSFNFTTFNFPLRQHKININLTLSTCTYRYTYIFNCSQILPSTEINPCKPMLHNENKEIKEVKFDLQQAFYLPDDKESDIHDIPPVGSLEFYFPP